MEDIPRTVSHPPADHLDPAFFMYCHGIFDQSVSRQQYHTEKGGSVHNRTHTEELLPVHSFHPRNGQHTEYDPKSSGMKVSQPRRKKKTTHRQYFFFAVWCQQKLTPHTKTGRSAQQIIQPVSTVQADPFGKDHQKKEQKIRTLCKFFRMFSIEASLFHGLPCGLCLFYSHIHPFTSSSILCGSGSLYSDSSARQYSCLAIFLPGNIPARQYSCPAISLPGNILTRQ